LTDCDATWVVTSHHVLDMSAMTLLRWQRPCTAHWTWSSYGCLKAERVN